MMDLREELWGVLIALAHTVENNEIPPRTDRFLLEALEIAKPQSPVDEDTLRRWVEQANEEKFVVSPDCRTCLYPCGKNENYDMQRLWMAEESVRRKKLQMMEEIQTLADKIRANQTQDASAMQSLYDGLFALGEDFEVDMLENFERDIQKALEN